MAQPPGGPTGFSESDGEAAVRLARAAVDAAVLKQRLSAPPLADVFLQNAGVFTTLSEYPSGRLRGCIGFAEPIMPLREALLAASRAAALEDSRFSPVTPQELDQVLVEVSLLTAPHELKAPSRAALLDLVQVGRHGLIVRSGRAGGLLLPQVAVEWRWGPEEFLEHTCQKAGLPVDAWLDDATRVYAFEAEVFAEESPRGAVVRHEGA